MGQGQGVGAAVGLVGRALDEVARDQALGRAADRDLVHGRAGDQRLGRQAALGQHRHQPPLRDERRFSSRISMRTVSPARTVTLQAASRGVTSTQELMIALTASP
jgi:hypothetical protein